MNTLLMFFQESPQAWTVRTFGADFVTLLITLMFIPILSTIAVITLKGQWTSKVVKMFSLTIIIFVALFTALTINNEKSSAALFALLGTTAGYILGKDDGPSTPDKNS